LEISFDKNQKTQGIIKISIKRADFQQEVNQKIKKYSKTANIKGFRPGKVPPGMIRKMYGKSLIAEAINKLISERLNTYLREGETQFLGEPMPIQKDEVFDWENAENFEFEYEIGFAEPFQIKVDKTIKLNKYSIKIDDQVIDKTIENLQRRFGALKNPEVVSEEDTLYGLANYELGNQEISLDLRDAEESFAKRVAGSKIGDVLEIDLKKNFKNGEVINIQLKCDEDELKKLKFEIKRINHYEPAPIDQKLFDNAFGKNIVKDVNGFRESVKEVISDNYKDEENQLLSYKIREKLIEDTKITLPEEFLKKWLVKANENMTPELLEPEFGYYAKEFQWLLISNQLVKDHEIKVEHEDVTNKVKELIKERFVGTKVGDQFNNLLDVRTNDYLQSENGKNYMKMFNYVQNNKVLDFIKNQITIEDREITFDEFVKLKN